MTPITARFPLNTNSYVQYGELRKSHEALERENVALREALQILLKSADKSTCNSIACDQARAILQKTGGANV